VAQSLANLDRRPNSVALAGDPQLVRPLHRRLAADLSEIDWIVSDLWRNEPDFDAFRAHNVTAPPGGPSPTFVAALGAAGRELRARSLERRRAEPGRLDVPILVVEATDLDAMTAEVLAACAATREG
jgi:hypothetical protein